MIPSVPAPDAPVASATNPSAPPENPAANGRDSKGRFTKGNPGGPGNPFARQSAALRAAAAHRLRPEDIEKVIDKLLALALEGNVAAARLLLAYSIGKPGAAADPDRLDQDEWQIFQQMSLHDPAAVSAPLEGLPLGVALEMARGALPDIAEAMRPSVAASMRTGKPQGIFGPPEETRRAKPVRQQTAANGGERKAVSESAAAAKKSQEEAKRAADRQQTASNGDPAPEKKAKPVCQPPNPPNGLKEQRSGEAGMGPLPGLNDPTAPERGPGG